MKKKTINIEDKLSLVIDLYQKKDYESSLSLLFPLIDRTSKKRRPDLNSTGNAGERIKLFLRDEIKIITLLIFQNSSIGNFVNSKNEDLAEIIYKYIRNNLIHEGEIDDTKITINESGNISFGADYWSIPNTFIIGLVLSVVISDENICFAGKNIKFNFKVFLKDKVYFLNNLWGKRKFLIKDLNL